MRAVVYARYSSDQQRDASIEDQLRICRARAATEGWVVVETYADAAMSGATNQRPQYQAMLQALRTGRFEIILSESLDRFSRDLEETASFYKHCIFNNVRIVTLSEGDISQLHIGLKGTMGALYLKDLSDKTRRGLEGRIRQGRSIGLPPYGYMAVRQLTETGEIDRGIRALDEPRVAIVQRIFEAYAGGASPRQIAKKLNQEGVPGPGGGIWYDASIRGRPLRRDGLLRNETYNGRLVWNRQYAVKDPDTGQPVRRYSRPDAIVTTAVPHLKIIDDDQWSRVQARLAAESTAARLAEGTPEGHWWDKRRAQHLLSGKVFCGVCGRGFASLGKDYLGCMSARQGTCRNASTIRRAHLTARVLEALGRQLMQPEHVTDFIAAFNAEWKRLAAKVTAQAHTRQRDLSSIERKMANIVDAIGDGRASPSLLAKLQTLEAQQEKLQAHPAEAPALPPALHPGIAQVYATKVNDLQAALTREAQPEALEAARALIDQVIVSPPETDGDPPGVELIGELMALLKASGIGTEHTPKAASLDDAVLSLFVSSVKEAPGAEPLLGSGAEPQPCSRSGQHAQVPQAGDFRVGVAGLAQDVLVVLAQSGCAARRGFGRTVDEERAADGQCGFAGIGDQRVGRAHLRVVGDVVQRADQAEGDPGRVQGRAPMRQGVSGEGGVEHRDERRGVGAARRLGCEARIIGEVRAADQIQ